MSAKKKKFLISMVQSKNILELKNKCQTVQMKCFIIVLQIKGKWRIIGVDYQNIVMHPNFALLPK